MGFGYSTVNHQNESIISLIYLPELTSVISECRTRDPDVIADGPPPTGMWITLDESSSLVLSQPQPQPQRPELELGLSELSSFVDADSDDESDISSNNSSTVSSVIVSSSGNGGR